LLLTKHEHVLDGMTLHTIETEKYKTNTIIIKFMAPLQEEDVTQRALLPYVLESETERYPSSTSLRSYLDELYGASLSVDVSKKGEYHIVSFKLEIANEIYLSDQTPLLDKAIDLLSGVIFSPALENGVFKSSTVDKEKRSLKQRIQAVYDDKMRYSNLRLVQEMCKDEPYHLHVNGRTEDIEEITSSSLYSYYQKMLSEDEVDIYIVGNIKVDQILPSIEKAFPFKKRESLARSIAQTKKDISKVNEVIDKEDVKQGKLNIGYRTNIAFTDEDYHALQLFNGIFGGFSHSKLFLNVREKESLAYYVASRVESHKGILMVMSGIEFENYNKAVTIIKEQMEAMKKGDFTDQDISQTKAVIKNQLLETIDTSRGIVEVLYHNVVAGEKRELEEWLTGIESVTKEDIVQVAEKVELDTIYFLTGLEGTE
jgi:predicted Zn-dependent peptidase